MTMSLDEDAIERLMINGSLLRILGRTMAAVEKSKRDDDLAMTLSSIGNEIQEIIESSKAKSQRLIGL